MPVNDRIRAASAGLRAGQSKRRRGRRRCREDASLAAMRCAPADPAGAQLLLQRARMRSDPRTRRASELQARGRPPARDRQDPEGDLPQLGHHTGGRRALRWPDADPEDLDAAAAIVYQAIEPTPQQRWPLLDAARGHAGRGSNTRTGRRSGAFKIRGGLVYFDALRAKSPASKESSAADARQPRPVDRICGAARTASRRRSSSPHGNDTGKNAAMKALGVELHRGRRTTSRRRSRRRARIAARARLAHGAVVPRRLVRGRGLVCAGAFSRRPRSRHPVRADRTGVGHLRRHRGAQRPRPPRADRRGRRRVRAGLRALAGARPRSSRTTRRRGSPTASPAARRYPTRSSRSAPESSAWSR